MDPINRATALMARQHGVAHPAQLRHAGITDEQVRARVASGSWTRSPGDVLVVAGAPDTSLRRIWTAYLAVGIRADGRERPIAVGGRSAATVLGVASETSSVVEVVRSGAVWCPRVPGVRVREVGDWAERRFVRRDGLLVTALADTLVDIAASFGDADYLALLQEQCFRHRRLLERVVARCGPGRAGSARARRAATRLAAGLDSPLHDRAVRVLRRAGLAPDACDVEVLAGAGPSDCVYFARGRPVVALEFDGDAHRVSRRTFLHDRAKDLLLREAGCVTLRFTAEHVADPLALVAHVRRTLAA
jgi:hypothetical protein